jgi:hypothetical protein
VGTPLAVNRPATCQTPSLGRGLATGETMRLGQASCACPAGIFTETRPDPNEPFVTPPPTLAGLRRYHSVSTQVTKPPRPCWRPHSAARAEYDTPYEGLCSAKARVTPR